MSCKLYANIGVGHENDWDTLERRLISAAQCNADAVVINKSTPWIMVPDEKKYASVDSKWGSLPFIEVAKRSELSEENATRLAAFANDIGIPIIWSVTDSTAAEFVKEFCDAKTVKLHYDATDLYELSRFCKNTFEHVIFNINHREHYEALYGNRKSDYTVYYTTSEFPPQPQDLQFDIMDKHIGVNFNVGYEGRETGIFPAMALVYKGVVHIEKYLGDDHSDNPSILTPAQFMDLFNSMLLLEEAAEVHAT